MTEKTSDYSTFQQQQPVLTIDIKEWYLHRLVEPIEFYKTTKQTPNHSSPKEIPRGCSKPLRCTIRVTSVPKRHGDERLVMSVWH